jgi:ABC-type branched-subunit amino acid transport system substrate-binding protein
MNFKAVSIAACAAACVLTGAASVNAQATKKGIVKLGVDEELSGTFVAVGLPPAVGVRFAVKEINDKGGFTVGDTTYTFEVVEADNQSTSAGAVAGMTKLVEDDKVKFVFGPTLGALGAQAEQISVPANVIELAAATTWQNNGDLSNPQKPLLFGTQMSAKQATQIEAAAFKKMGIKKIAYMAADDDTTKGVYPFFQVAAKDAGLEVVEILFPPNTADYSPYVSRAKGENVEGIFFLQPQAVAPVLLRNIIDLGAGPKGFGGFNISPNVALSTAIGKPISIPFFTMSVFPSFNYPPSDKVKAFVERISAFEPKIIGANAGFVFYTYDYVYMLAEAMKKAGSVDDTAKIAKALTDLSYDGVAGRICFGKEMRTAILDGSLVSVQDGKVQSETFPSSCK